MMHDFLIVLAWIFGYIGIGFFGVVAYHILFNEEDTLGSAGDIAACIFFWPFIVIIFLFWGTAILVGNLITLITGKKFSQPSSEHRR